MRGSGLSLERFIKGKAQRTKADAKSKKKVIIRKAQRKREYEKVKKREGISTQRGRNPVNTAAAAASADDDEDASSGPSSFYDRFFNDLKRGAVDSDNEADDNRPSARARAPGAASERQHTAAAGAKKPDPFFKAKQKAASAKLERQRAQEAKEQQRAEVAKRVTSRKKRHVKLSQRTASGQPVVKNHITDILSRLQAETKKQKTSHAP